MAGFSHPRIEKLPLDVTSDEDVKRVVEHIVGKEGKIDIVVNNAGIGAAGMISSLPVLCHIEEPAYRRSSGPGYGHCPTSIRHKYVRHTPSLQECATYHGRTKARPICQRGIYCRRYVRALHVLREYHY